MPVTVFHPTPSTLVENPLLTPVAMIVPTLRNNCSETTTRPRNGAGTISDWYVLRRARGLIVSSSIPIHLAWRFLPQTSSCAESWRQRTRFKIEKKNRNKKGHNNLRYINFHKPDGNVDDDPPDHELCVAPTAGGGTGGGDFDCERPGQQQIKPPRTRCAGSKTGQGQR